MTVAPLAAPLIAPLTAVAGRVCALAPQGLLSRFRRDRRIRRRTPTVLQMEAVECGAASLSMVLGFYGCFVPLEELRYVCGVSRDGTKASNLLKAARRYGLKAKGFTMDPQGLADLPLPLIVFWNFNHFVVVEGLGPGEVHLNDPATGPRTVSEGEFSEAFTGVALAFEPGPEFQPAGRRASALGGLFSRLNGAGSAFVLVLLASVCLVIPGLLVPAFTRIFVDFYLVEGLRDWLWPLLLGMVAAAGLRIGLTVLQQETLIRLQTRLTVGGSARFFWHVLRLPVGFFAQRYSGEIGARVMLNDRVATLVTGDLATTLVSLLTMVVYALIMLQYDWVLTVVGIALAGVNGLAFALVSRRLADASQRLLMDRGKLTGVVMQGLQMIESYKASGTEDLFFARWAGYHAKVINTEQDLGRRRAILGAVPVLIGLISATAMLVIGGLRVMDGALTMGMLVAFQTLMASFAAPAAGLVGLGAQFQETQGCLTRLDDVLAHPCDSEFAAPAPALAPSPVRPAAVALAKVSGRVTVEGVSFGFLPTSPPLIQDFTLHLEPGSRIALVGGSGSGKSTVGKLITGLYRPWSGRILFDGQPIEQVPRAILRASVALVDQDIALFEGSVRDNLSLWDGTLAEERLVRAAQDAAVHGVIAQRPDSYDHKIQEGGRNFSGGQRQRIEIARALAADPTVLVLDEATSALDAETERAVMENLRRRGCTSIIIAHRLSTVRDCDEILVLEKGRVVERGRHEALMAMGGLYRTLVES